MANLNKCMFIGRLGADPESKSMPSGSSVCNFRIAVSSYWKDKSSGEKKESTEWISIAFFGRLAEIAAQYLRKGSKVYVEGSIRTRKWTDKDGKDRYSTEIIGSELQMLDGKPQQERRAQEPQQAQSSAKPDFDDDIPF